MKKAFLYIITIFLLCSFSCEKLMERKYVINLDNKSDIRVYLAAGVPETSLGIYPDSSLPADKPFFQAIAPKSKGTFFYSSNKFEYYFEKAFHNDTMSVYLFNADSVDAISWNLIQGQYKILKRYDLSLQDLQATNFAIPYPR